jgi:hypothetical protein
MSHLMNLLMLLWISLAEYNLMGVYDAGYPLLKADVLITCANKKTLNNVLPEFALASAVAAAAAAAAVGNKCVAAVLESVPVEEAPPIRVSGQELIRKMSRN